MKEKKQENSRESLKEFDENPFDPEKVKPEDIVRLFYLNDVPIIPVVSKRGLLIGILNKKDLVSELSDIERVRNLKIDKFITRLARKISLDDLLPYGKIKEFVVINIFGEVKGKWSRLQLFTASEKPHSVQESSSEVEKQKEEQILEWMIYLILEFIPRALYAVNTRGKTMFYNSHFEESYLKKFNTDIVDSEKVEKALKSSSKNELYSSSDSNDLLFYNSELDIYYEKIPMKSKGKKVGYLIYCDSKEGGAPVLSLPGVDLRGMSLSGMMDAIERQLIVTALNQGGDIASAAKDLDMSKKALAARMNKYKIKL
jgi:transcriptional regulator with PAS, ATPase and Fis domain